MARHTVKEAVPYYARSKKRWIVGTVWLLVLAVIIFMAVQVFIVMVPNVKTQVAILETMTDFIEAKGLVSFQSTEVLNPGGVIYYTAGTGERVPVGEPVATLYAGEEAAMARKALDGIDAEIAQLESAQKSLLESADAEVLLSQRQAGVYDLQDAIQSKNYAAVEQPKADITLAANKLLVATGENISFSERISALYTQREELAARATPSGEIAAPQTGFFVPSGRGDRLITGYEAAQQATPQGLLDMMQQEPQFYAENIAGHIVQNYRWHFFTVLDTPAAQVFYEGQKLNIMFPDVDEEMLPVKVQSITGDEAAGKTKIEFVCDRINAKVLSLRTETAHIVFRTEKGIRVDKQALRVIEGVQGVYVLMPGNVVAFRKIEILFENNNYLLVSSVPSETNQIELYDKIIVDSGGEELYDGRVV